MSAFAAALTALAQVITQSASATPEKAAEMSLGFEGGIAHYSRKAGDKTAVAKIEMAGDLKPLMKGMKAMTGDSSAEWAIAHVAFDKTITDEDLEAGIKALTAVRKTPATTTPEGDKP